MTGAEVLQRLSEFVLLAIFASVLLRAIRYPRRANLLSALFFGMIAAILALGWVNNATELPLPFAVLTAALLISLSYILLRLAHEFDRVPSLALRAAEVGLAISIVLLVIGGDPFPAPVVLFVVAYFVTTQSYVSWRFLRCARRSIGVLGRRLLAVATGNAILAVILLLAGFSALEVGALSEVRSALSRIATLAVGVAYYIGFAPPRLLERAWQAPDVERFLRINTAIEPGSIERVSARLERAAGAVIGLRTFILLMNADGQLLSPSRETDADAPEPANPESLMAMQAFHAQAPLFVEDAARVDPANAEMYRYFGATTLLVAPISMSERWLGVLCAVADRPSLFAEDDLELLQMMAGQIAVTLRDHELLRERSLLEAQEEVMRLKEQFLSAAAHDLKTPLTTLLGQAQLMERRSRRNPDAPLDVEGLQRMIEEGRRMRALVEDLLDSSQVEYAGFLEDRVPADLVEIARAVAADVATPRHAVQVEGDRVVVAVDIPRIRQVLFNLLDNAVKHSPGGGDVHVQIFERDGDAHITVVDHGVGISADDYDVIFERFRRGSGISDSRSGGLGLGLFICKRIVEEHGGRITVASRLGAGSEFSVVLPGVMGTEGPVS